MPLLIAGPDRAGPLLRLARRIAALFALLTLATGSGSAADASREYLLKAAFLLNFAQFVEWPPEAFAGPEAPIRIGVLGADPFAGALEATVRGETVRDRPLEVVHATRAEDLRHCQMVFVGPSEAGRSREVVEALAGAPVLTVSDNPDFTAGGGIIRFFLEGAKVRFQINPSAAERCRLKLSAQLLALGTVVPRATP